MIDIKPGRHVTWDAETTQIPRGEGTVIGFASTALAIIGRGVIVDIWPPLEDGSTAVVVFEVMLRDPYPGIETF